MGDHYPDEYWLMDFERRLNDRRLLTREESLGLIAELRRVRLERNELRAALEPLQIKLIQHLIRQSRTNGSTTCWRSAMGAVRKRSGCTAHGRAAHAPASH